jgi:hypothetical protein
LKEECQYLTNERDSLLQKETGKKKPAQTGAKNQLKQISTQQIHLHQAMGVLQLMHEQAQKASIERANLFKKKKNSRWRNMTAIIFELLLLKLETQRFIPLSKS